MISPLVCRRALAGVLLLVAASALPRWVQAGGATESGSSAAARFRDANELARTGDLPKALASYAALARSGHESASLYWNWAQAAAGRGASGEALWALLRAREIDPGDRAVSRDLERLREALNLDPAEIAPEPLAAAGRTSRRYRLDVLAALLLVASLLAHAVSRLRGSRHLATAAVVSFIAGALTAAFPIAGAAARPTATVVHRATPLFDAASPGAEPTGTLREGEVVPVLQSSGTWLRIEDGAGARGWARAEDVWRLDRVPALLD